MIKRTNNTFCLVNDKGDVRWENIPLSGNPSTTSSLYAKVTVSGMNATEDSNIMRVVIDYEDL